MPALIPAPADGMKDCVQPAGMVATVDLTPAPEQVAPCARPQLELMRGGTDIRLGCGAHRGHVVRHRLVERGEDCHREEALALSYMTSGTPPMCVSLYVDSSHACIVGKVLSYWKQCDTPPCRAKPGKRLRARGRPAVRRLLLAVDLLGRELDGLLDVPLRRPPIPARSRSSRLGSAAKDDHARILRVLLEAGLHQDGGAALLRPLQRRRLEAAEPSVPVDAAGPPTHGGRRWKRKQRRRRLRPDSQGLPSSLMSKRPVGPGRR